VGKKKKITTVEVRLTQEQLARLQAAATALGLELPQFMRSAALGVCGAVLRARMPT